MVEKKKKICLYQFLFVFLWQKLKDAFYDNYC